ncbi:MAG TPA: efflux RND transporter periplasmic adaptor subunit [Steroidobacteraceae bacterium]|nr:efflux RND transporter periplasmic adaptor subunit [Steroidobacteraceae bacterium]
MNNLESTDLRASSPHRRVIAALWVALAASSGAAWSQEAAPVRVVRPAIGTVADFLTLTGTVTSARSAALSPRVSGLVARVHVDAGSRVKAGDLLVELDDAIARLELERVKAAVDEGRIRLEEAERVRDEARRLVADRNIPKSQADAAEAEVRIVGAALARLQAERRQQEELVARHRLLAPFPGVVAQKRTEAGEWVATGTPVVDLVAVEDTRVDVQVPQERHDDLREGTPVTVQLDAASGEPIEGRIAALVPVKDPASRTFLVRVAVPQDERLTPGMSATVAFRLDRSLGAMTVPRDAVIRQPDGSTLVWVVVEEGGRTVAAPRPVQIGRPVGDMLEVRSGLDPQAQVVVRGNEMLREGRPVRIVER